MKHFKHLLAGLLFGLASLGASATVEISPQYPADLNSAYPGANDPKVEGDDHLRNLKTALKNAGPGYAGAFVVSGTDVGVADAYALSPTPTLPSYTTGTVFYFKALNANTGAATLNVSGLGAKGIKTISGATPGAGEINGEVILRYDGTNMVLIGGSEMLSKTGTQTVNGTITFMAGPNVPTATLGTSSTQAASTAFVAGTAFASTLPAQAGNSGKVITTDGTTASWGLPIASQAGNSGKVLTTDGSTTSWTYVTPPLFGDGSDGAVSISSGTTTITRNMFYTNLTLSGTGVLDTAGYQVYVSGTLDITAAQAGAITRTPIAGGNASGTTAGAAPAALAEITAGGAGQGLVGATGATTNVAGTAGTQATKTAAMLGGYGGASKTAGTGNAGANAGGAGLAKASVVASAVTPTPAPVTFAGFALAKGGVAGSSGPSGGGASTSNSGAGGASGDGGGVIDIRAKTIARGAGTAVSAIKAIGAAGGNASAGTNNAGGGSGGGGGGGGFIQIIYQTLTGSTATNAIDVSGGVGGNGAAGSGNGTAGQGADGGDGGRVRVIDIGAGTITENVSAVTGSTNTTVTGGAGAVARYSL